MSQQAFQHHVRKGDISYLISLFLSVFDRLMQPEESPETKDML